VPRTVKMVASTFAPNAHTEPRSISENFWSEIRLWILRFMKETIFSSGYIFKCSLAAIRSQNPAGSWTAISRCPASSPQARAWLSSPAPSLPWMDQTIIRQHPRPAWQLFHRVFSCGRPSQMPAAPRRRCKLKPLSLHSVPDAFCKLKPLPVPVFARFASNAIRAIPSNLTASAPPLNLKLSKFTLRAGRIV